MPLPVAMAEKKKETKKVGRPRTKYLDVEVPDGVDQRAFMQRIYDKNRSLTAKFPCWVGRSLVALGFSLLFETVLLQPSCCKAASE